MPQPQNPEALERAIAWADLTVACLKGTLRLWTALGQPQGRAGRLLRQAELRAEHLRDARAVHVFGQGRRRKAA
jgi:hypothetical protein